MIKRVFLGVCLLIIFVLSFVFKLFPFLALIILFLGIYELVRLFPKNKMLVLFYGLLFIGAMITSIFLFYKDTALCFLTILVVVFNDSWAYAFGKFFGRTHFSKISPNKTIEGLIGGILGTIALLYILSLVLGPNTFNYFAINRYHIPALVMIIVYCLLGNVGDIFESYFKRQLQIKDTSHLLGEQGGILDRVDSWIFTMMLSLIIFLCQ